MFDPDAFQNDLGRAEKALRRKLKLRDGSFPELVAKAGSRLPKKARAAAAEIDRARFMSGHPKLRRQLDSRALRKPFRQFLNAVGDYDAKRYRNERWMPGVRSMGVNLLLLIVLLVLLWVFLKPA